VGIEDADFVIGQAHVGDLRIEWQGTCAARVRASKGRVRIRCLWISSCALTVTWRWKWSHWRPPGGDFVAFHIEEVAHRAKGLADQQFESAFGGLEFVAFILQLLDALPATHGGSSLPGGRRGRAA